jgi:D-alanyl-D-alanine dipeptidase
MSKAKYMLAIFIMVLTFFYECKPENSSNVNKNKIETDTIKGSVVEKPQPNKTEDYLREMGLINIQDSLPEILVDLKYATEDNFLKMNFYGELTHAFIQYECYLKLKNAFNILQQQKPGYTFIVYDAVRSIESQQLMWDSIDVPANTKHWYVANPQRGSIHNYGMALDISIVDDQGNVLDMGTEFDYFGELAYPEKTGYFFNNGDLTQQQYDNRNMLMSIMSKAYFYVSLTEWWHYNASSIDYAKNKYKIFSYTPKNDSQ